MIFSAFLVESRFFLLKMVKKTEGCKKTGY